MTRGLGKGAARLLPVCRKRALDREGRPVGFGLTNRPCYRLLPPTGSRHYPWDRV